MHESIDTWWIDILTSLTTVERCIRSRDGDVCGEIIGYHGKFDPSKQMTLLMNPEREMDPAYSAAEVLWYLSGQSAIAMLEAYAPGYGKFASGPNTYGAYGPRLMWKRDIDPKNLLETAIQMLGDDNPTRQAVVAIWHPEDLWQAKRLGKDIPCTLHLQFILRENKLHMIVGMRSNDAWLGFPLDVFAFTCIQRIVAYQVGAEVGSYTHNVGSMHLYSRYLVRVKRALKYPTWRPGSVRRNNWTVGDSLSTMKLAVELEQELRTHSTICETHKLVSLGSMSMDLLRGCAKKLQPELDLGPFTSGALDVISGVGSQRAVGNGS